MTEKVQETIYYPSRPVRILEQESEGGNGGGGIRFEAVVSEVDFRNNNGRIYPKEVMQRALDEMMEQPGRHPGLVDHPGWFTDSPGLSDVGIFWESYRFDGNLAVATGVTVPTRKGRDLEALLQSPVAPGFSTRGYGTTREETNDGVTSTVFEEFTFGRDGSIDAVLTPSVYHARAITVNGANKSIESDSDSHTKGDEKMSQNEQNQDQLLAELELLRKENQTLAGTMAATSEAVAALTARLQAQEHAQSRSSAIESAIGGHAFAATIRARVEALIEAGANVTAENAAAIVSVITEMVEAVGSAGEPAGTPRGDVQAEAEAEAGESNDVSAEMKEELRKAGLL